MNQKPYSSYHGRKSLLQRILTGVAVLLAAALLLAVVALFVLPNFLTYNGEGTEVDWSWLPWYREPAEQTAPPSDGDIDSEVIFEEPGAETTASPSAPALAETDLSFYTRRETPRGLVSGRATGSQGTIADMTGELLTGNGDLRDDRESAREENAALTYAAAWLDPNWTAALEDEQFADKLIERCLLLADMGYDEILFSEAVPEGDGADLAKLYRDVKDALDKAGWEGRLGLVLEQSLAGSRYDEDLIPAIAQSFDRLYFRRAMETRVKSALTDNGFSNSPADIVTVYGSVPNVTWAWAVLPR